MLFSTSQALHLITHSPQVNKCRTKSYTTQMANTIIIIIILYYAN